jgi:4-amino-4-deoxy-L-arabinose transferase-like glycosyltransferase
MDAARAGGHTAAKRRGLRSTPLKAVVAGILALIFLSQGMTAPFQKDEEARPAGIILDIVNHGNWLIPADLYGEATRKPPLYYWLGALIAKARGGIVDESGARAVSLIAAAAIASVVIAFTCINLDTSAGGLALLFLLGLYGFASRGAHARTDMLFTGFLFAAYCVLYTPAGGRTSTSRAIAAGLLLGLAVTTKGPLAIVLIALALLIHAALTRANPLRMLTQPWPWIVAAVAVGIGALWYVPAFARDPQLFRVQFLQENFGHLASAKLGGTGEAARPFYYLWLRLIGATLPLILYLPAALARLIPAKNSRDPILYQLAMTLAVLGIFTLANSKRDIYILPALPPLAIVLAAPFASYSPATRPRLVAILTDAASAIAGCALLLIALAGLILAGRPGWINQLLGSMQSSDAAYTELLLRDFALGHLRFVVTMLVIAASSAAALWLVKKHRSYAAAVSIGVASLAAVSLWIGVLKPELSRERTLKNFVMRAEPIVGHREVHVVGGPEYELSYYFGRGIPGWRRSMLQPASGCASYLIVWSNRLNHVFRGVSVIPPPVLESDSTTSRGRLLLLNVGDPQGSRGCPQR